MSQLYFRTHEARSAVRPLLKARGLTVADSVGVGLEISKQGINKAVGLQTLCDYLGIDLDDTMAIGAGGNDVELLQTAGLGVAMGNAGPDVAATADVVTDDCDHDGAAHAIMRYMLEKIKS